MPSPKTFKAKIALNHLLQEDIKNFWRTMFSYIKYRGSLSAFISDFHVERRKQKSWLFTTFIDIVRHFCKLLIYFFVFFSLFAGKGLGKEEQGISKAIKVNVKTLRSCWGELC